ncbi:DUF4265 domain-containing protein [Nostoc sp. CHAB 5844]|nr:DUF4265 domain-containing protein [Nostoc sp. CHAB 5844]
MNKFNSDNDNEEMIVVRFQLELDWHEYITEDIHVSRLPDRELQGIVESIPFFIRQLSFGDIIEFNKLGEIYRFSRIVEESKNSTVLLFFKIIDNVFIKSILENILEIGIDFEKSMRIYGLYSLNIKDKSDIDKLENLIEQYVDEKIEIQTNSFRI